MYSQFKCFKKTISVAISITFMIGSANSFARSTKGIEVIPSENSKKVDILYDGKLFTSYIYPDNLEKPVLYPVYTSKGTIVTRGFPREPRPGERVDHPHHVGIWFNYGSVNGLDFWNNSYAIPQEKKNLYGHIKHLKIIKAESGPKMGTLIVETQWLDSNNNLVLTEQTKFEFTGDKDIRRIDRTTTLTAKEQKVVFKDNKEGLMGMRVDRAFEEPSEKPEVFTDANGNPTTVAALNNEGVNGAYRSSTGLDKGAVWGTRANWVKLSATKNNEPITIAITDNKQNVGFPAHWHARGYGLFGVNNLAAKTFNPKEPETSYTLDPGKSTTFKYRILVKSGSFLSDEEMNREFEEFNK